MDANLSYKVKTIKEEYGKLKKVQGSKVRFLFKGAEMVDGHVISSYNVENGDVIIVAI